MARKVYEEYIRTAAGVSMPTGCKYIIIEAGDTLYRLSDEFNVYWETLQAWNGLDGLKIITGNKFYVDKTHQTYVELKTGYQYIWIVEHDTLYRLALEFNKDADTLRVWNNTTYEDLIFAGEKFYVNKDKSTNSSSSNKTASVSRIPRIDKLELSAGSSDTLYAVWTCDTTDVKSWKYEWEYCTGDEYKNGSVIWYKGTDGTIEDLSEKYSKYTIPNGAKLVRFRVRPEPDEIKTGTLGLKKKAAFEAKWSLWREYNTSGALLPTAPENVTAEIDPERMVLKIELSEYPVEELIEKNLLGSTKLHVQVIVNNNKLHSDGTKKISISKYGHASCECKVTEGDEYSVRCRVVRGTLESDLKTFGPVYSRPSAPSKLTATPKKIAATGEYNIHLTWGKSPTAETYTIQHAVMERGVEPLWDSSNDDRITTLPETNDNKTEYVITNAEMNGKVHYFRVAANRKDGGSSKWSNPTTGLTIGTPPKSPVTWSSTTTATIGEPLYLYWVHNPTDGSSETNAHIHMELYKPGIDASGNETEILLTPPEGINYYQRKSQDLEEKNQTSFYDFNTNTEAKKYLSEGVKLRWRVRTAGASNEFGNNIDENWSIVREVNIYAKPELTFTVTTTDGIAYNSDFTCTSFPLKVSASAGPKTQKPTSYHISIISNETYETVDTVGNDVIVSAGDMIYSKYFDEDTTFEYSISAGDVNLDNSISYTISCIVSMNSGLTDTHSMNFKVDWTDKLYEPYAQVVFDPETYVAHIHPYCEEYIYNFYRAEQSGTRYIATSEPVSIADGVPVFTEKGKPVYTTTKERVYVGLTTDEDGNYIDGKIYYYEVGQPTVLVEGITLSVYRREYDGTFTEIATGIDNTKNTFVTDPHPALDYARYRIVATVTETGAVSYTDLPGIYVGEPGIIIQWDEEWTSFDIDPNNTDSLSSPNWAGSLLRLPYNVDVSPSYNIDTAFVEYAGREHPVSYYGTHLGETATWSTTIPKTDKETIYALHRLAKWTGNVYAREPSGTGYWASVSVSFPQKHLDTTIPVSLSLTRVEGGM